MKVKLECKSLTDIKCDLLVVNEFEGVKTPGGATGAADKALEGLITKLSRSGEIDGKLGKATIIHSQGKLPAEHVAVVGLGPSKKFGLDEVRIAAAAAIRSAKEVKAKKVATIVHGAGIGGLNAAEAAQATVEGSILGDYEYKEFVTDKEILDPRAKIEELIVIERTSAKAEKMKEGVKIGEILGKAQNRARDLVNAPANKVTPTYLANYAKKLGLEVEILDPSKEDMKAIEAVAKGSREPAKVLVIGQQKAGSIALIGKGITFDSGGISIKSPKKLWLMKIDMAGAAAVIETLKAVKEIGIKKNIIGIIPLTENMPDGAALKPGDVIGSLSGKTIEIISTDAEGRLILADAITYAKKLGAKQIIDVATLTGAVASALGDVASGIMGNDEKLIGKLMEAGAKSGEKIWQLPLYEEYKEYLKSNIADMKNCDEKRLAGPSAGGMFLQKFVEDTLWAHIDIGGVAFLEKSRGYLSEGATGIPLRTLVEFLK